MPRSLLIRSACAPTVMSFWSICSSADGWSPATIFCRESVRFRSFEDDLLDDQRWQAKDTLIADTGLPRLQQPIEEHLAMLEQHLERRLAEVNQRIASGDNAYIQ